MTRRAVFKDDGTDAYDDGVDPITDFPTTGAGGVDSIAKDGDTPLTGDVTLSEGANVTLTQVGQDIEIAASGTGSTPTGTGFTHITSGAQDAAAKLVEIADVASSLKPSGTAIATDESLRRLGTGSTHAAAGDDSRFPTAGEKNALAGTSGTPGSGNKYVTDGDARLSAAADLATHLGDTSDAHDASAISADSTTLVGTGTDVQAVLEELDNGIADHLADSSAAHAASAISADSTTLVGTGTDVQAVLEELDNGIADHLADTSDAHDASAISVLDTGGLYTGTDVEAALAELGLPVTQAQAEAGTSTSILRWTPERVAQAIAALGFAPNVAVQVKTDASGTYTPSTGMVKVLVICVGGGGGAPAETVADAAVSGGGGGGAAIKVFSAATIGASQAYVVGQTSTSGGNTSGLGTANALLQATGGAVGVTTGLATTLGTAVQGGLGGIGTLGDLNIRGGPGGPAVIYSASAGAGGNGGNSIFGGGGRGGVTITTVQQGEAGQAYGGGAGGGHTSDGTDLSAVAGAAGVIYFIEFLKAGAGTAAAGQPGGSELIYKYVVTGSDKASIDTGVDTATAGSLDWTNGDLLEIFVYARTDEAVAESAVNMTVNNDTGSNYDRVLETVVNATVTGANSLAQTAWARNVPGASAGANSFGNIRITMPNYAATVGQKMGEIANSKADATAGNNRAELGALQWRSTAAISRFKVIPATGGALLKVGTTVLIYKRKSV